MIDDYRIWYLATGALDGAQIFKMNRKLTEN